MRIPFAFLALPLLALSAQVQTAAAQTAAAPTAAAPSATAPTAAPPTAAAPTATAPTATAPTATAKPTKPRLTMEQRFEQANVTHDGHLTEAQAKAGYQTIAKHFAAIDQDKKGYVTEDDIRTYNKTQRALHRRSATVRHQPNS